MAASLVKGVDSLRVDTLSKGTMFSVTTGAGNTKGSKYLFAMTDSGRHSAAIFTRSSTVPTRYALCRIMGSTSEEGVSPGVIAVGSNMHIRDHGDISDGIVGIIQTRPVTGIWMFDTQPHADSIVRRAEKCFAAAIEAVIVKEFSNDRHDSIRDMVSKFGNAAGKSAALGALVRGNNSVIGSGNKLGAAMEVLLQYWHRFWEVEFPEIAGDPITDLNESRWNMFDSDRDIKAGELLSGHELAETEAM